MQLRIVERRRRLLGRSLVLHEEQGIRCCRMAALLALVLTLPFASAIALAQPFPGFGTRPLSVPANAGSRSQSRIAFRPRSGRFKVRK